MKDQINASKILHSSAIYIQSMKTTRSLGKELLNDQKCPKKIFTPSSTNITQTTPLKLFKRQIKCMLCLQIRRRLSLIDA